MRHRILGCFGWGLIIFGLMLLIHRHWGLTWGWLAVMIGALLYYRIIRGTIDRGFIFLTTVLFVMGGAKVVWDIGLIDFEGWRLWPIFLGSVGLAFMLAWSVKEAGWWVLPVGGALLVLSSAGLGMSSWFKFRHLVHDITDYWPALLIIFGVSLILSYWHKRADRRAGQHSQ